MCIVVQTLSNISYYRIIKTLSCLEVNIYLYIDTLTSILFFFLQMLSLLPARIIRLLEFIGFSGNRVQIQFYHGFDRKDEYKGNTAILITSMTVIDSLFEGQ